MSDPPTPHTSAPAGGPPILARLAEIAERAAWEATQAQPGDTPPVPDGAEAAAPADLAEARAGITSLAAQVTGLRGDLTGLRDALADLRGALESRAAAVEDEVGALAARLEALGRDAVAATSERLDALAERLDTALAEAGERTGEAVVALGGAVEQALGRLADGLVRSAEAPVAAQDVLERLASRLAGAAGGLLDYLAERDRLLEGERDRVLHALLDDLAAGLTATERRALAGRVSVALSRRRDARDAERWRAARTQDAPVAPSAPQPTDLAALSHVLEGEPGDGAGSR